MRTHLNFCLCALWMFALGCSDPEPSPAEEPSPPEEGLDATVRNEDAGSTAKTGDAGARGALDATTPRTRDAAPAVDATQPADPRPVADGGLGPTPLDARVDSADAGALSADAASGPSTPELPDAGDAGGAQAGSDAGGGDAGAELDHGPPYAVGTARFALTVAPSRVLDVQVWYPAADSARAQAAAGRPVADFETGAHKATLTGLLADAPDGCTSKTMHAADAPPAFARAQPFPLIAFSHCMDCVRFSMFSVAEQLASRGFVVAAPDHLGGTIYEAKGVLNSDFLRTRANDIRGVVDALLDPASTAVPVAVRGKLDAARVGAFGHSYGSVTTGLVLQTDPRIKAGIMIAAPPESALLSGVTLANIRQPGLFFEALEDNSITALGNTYIESNYADYPAPARLIQVADAGHWSFTDIAGMGNFDPGCGSGQRMTNPLSTFRYLDNEVARSLTKSYVTAFFVRHLLGDASADATLNMATPANVVTVKMHN